MRLATKIVSIYLLGLVVLTVVYGYIAVQREDQRLKQEMEEEARTLGRALEEQVVVVLSQQGHQGVVQIVRGANDRHQHLTIRWVVLDGSTRSSRSLAVSLERLRSASMGSILSATRWDDLGHARQHMYYPIDVAAKRVGSLEFAESLSPVHQYTRGTVWRLIALGGAMLSCGVAVVLAGVRLIGQPLQRLIEKTRRIGRGDYSDPIRLEGNDELGQLAGALNSMCDQLAEAREKADAESTARLAAVEQLRHVDRLKTIGRLASGMAHELGTPLNVVSGRAELIATGRIKESEARDSAKAIKTEAERMTTLIRQLLDFARRRSPERRAVDLRQVAGQVLQLLRPLAEKQNVAISLEGNQEPLTACVDASQIQQVLTNLIVNGIQAMPDGGEVTIGLQPGPLRAAEHHEAGERDHCCITVKDEGQGIRDEDIAHIFDPFFTTKDVGEGTGLGLSVSYGIVQDHGGWIGVESEVGKGSCFSVYLPCETDPSSQPEDPDAIAKQEPSSGH